jgi:hypothetical protein
MIHTSDPFGGTGADDFDLRKMRHIFHDNDRVIVHRIGRHGKIAMTLRGDKFIVKLDDTGHEVQCFGSELEPELFAGRAHPGGVPRTGPAAEADGEAVEKSAEPYSFGDDEPEASIEWVRILEVAIRDRRLSDADRAIVTKELDKIKGLELDGTDIYGSRAESDGRYGVLQKIAESYRGESLQKRKRAGLRVGMTVRDRQTGKVGKLVSLAGGMVKIEMEDGGELHVLEGRTEEVLLPLGKTT